MAVRVLKVYAEDRYFIQFAPEDTLVFPLEALTQDQWERALSDGDETAQTYLRVWRRQQQARGLLP